MDISGNLTLLSTLSGSDASFGTLRAQKLWLGTTSISAAPVMLWSSFTGAETNSVGNIESSGYVPTKDIRLTGASVISVTAPVDCISGPSPLYPELVLKASGTSIAAFTIQSHQNHWTQVSGKFPYNISAGTVLSVSISKAGSGCKVPASPLRRYRDEYWDRCHSGR